jgi:hypothetical protein
VNNISIRWKLVLVAAVALAQAAITAPAMAARALEIAPGELSVNRPPAWTENGMLRPAGMAAHRAAQPDGIDQARRLSPGAIIGLICAIAASSVALGVAFGLRRRIDRIAGPDPDKAEDD